jgi:hypothetical protein
MDLTAAAADHRVRNFRQALASPHPGCRIHDPHAADLLSDWTGAEIK